MSELFGLDIQGLVTDALQGHLRPITITREVSSDYNPIEGGETTTTETFTTEGIEEDYKKFYEAGLVSASEVPILMLAKPLGTKPKKDDRITIDGENYTMTGIISKDPAKSTWTVKAEV